MKRAGVSLLLLMLVGFAGQAFSAGPGSPRAASIYPPQDIPLRMEHKLHLDNGLSCEVCHSAALTSTKASDRNLPPHTLCAACHRAELPNAHEMFPRSGCSDCHEGWVEGLPEHIGPDLAPLADAPRPPAVVFPTARLNFSHQLHVDQGAVCLDCHQGIDSADRGTVQHLPTMDTCLGCHDGRRAPDECTTCHLADPASGRVATGLDSQLLAPKGRFRPDDHGDPEWLHRHEFAARADQDQCAACHEQRECLQCHDGVQKIQRIHPGDWQMTHGLQAVRRDLECKACHDTQSFCRDCHDRVQTSMGIFPGERGNPQGAARFHPPGWKGELGEVPDGEHHSFQARRSLETCSSCHQPEQCVECHSFVNPHPDSFSGEGKWRFGQGDGSVCTTCHLPADDALNGLR